MLVLIMALGTPAHAQQEARDLFGAQRQPTAGQSQPVGGYSRGCVAGAVQLPADGPGWQAMRLSRDRRWGAPELVSAIEKIAHSVQQDGWPGILVGDMGQARGGPMRSGHASHQSGLDVDLWLEPMPTRTLTAREREEISARSMLKKGTRQIDPARFGEGQRLLIYRAAQLPEVERIFVAPGIKKSLCAITWRDPSFLRKVRPWYGHDDHIHVRLSCPAGAADCLNQAPIPPGDGCGDDLDYWFTEEPYRPSTSPPGKPLTMADLPQACTAVLTER
ncbi:murein endopeptidase. Metallo peptidase. MEROPS family M74 [Devosia enhydra]|uniref:Murein endopeptidase. Metallo peptidase. MEROPS family M74 n=1 Tax=Devosia enhydra TaxID=665118 RepID=A0A1K2HZD5_9HYPH|nr:penicillin-insensitive murein endopeptidase [Devosia enhydra]SFZ85501.1 murein endopeptidase. Metallo peptidase. MEROPS family M74 [Devosia enhydra]